jgi:hypothetical protein
MSTAARLTACTLPLLTLWAACSPASAATTVSSLTIIEAPTPPLQVPGYDTSGSYIQVRGGGLDLRAVNRALRRVVLADQRAYAPYAREERSRTVYEENGVYRTAVDRRYVSASTVVVSALMPLTREVFPGQHEGDGWLAMNVRVPSGSRVGIRELFASPGRGLRALAAAWKAEIRRTRGRRCLRIYPNQYRASAANYRRFALTPSGVAVGSWEIAACYRLVATVPYGRLRPYLSRLGATLVAGVRAPRRGCGS